MGAHQPSARSSDRWIPRRAFLKGIGVTMALPLLESIPTSWGAEAVAGAAAGGFPKRFGVIFMGNGVSPPHWTVEGQGADMKFGRTLEVLEPIKSKVNVVSGLF